MARSARAEAVVEDVAVVDDEDVGAAALHPAAVPQRRRERPPGDDRRVRLEARRARPPATARPKRVARGVERREAPPAEPSTSSRRGPRRRASDQPRRPADAGPRSAVGGRPRPRRRGQASDASQATSTASASPERRDEQRHEVVALDGGVRRSPARTSHVASEPERRSGPSAAGGGHSPSHEPRHGRAAASGPNDRSRARPRRATRSRRRRAGREGALELLAEDEVPEALPGLAGSA